MKINTVEEFWDALDACKDFVCEHKGDTEHAMLLCVGAHEDRVGFLAAGNSRDVVSATCCALDNDPDFREIWSAVSMAFAKANSKVKILPAETVGEFPVTPNKLKS